MERVFKLRRWADQGVYVKLLEAALLLTLLGNTAFAQTVPPAQAPEKEPPQSDGKVLNQIEQAEGEGTTDTTRQSQDEKYLEDDSENTDEDTGDIYNEEEEW